MARAICLAALLALAACAPRYATRPALSLAELATPLPVKRVQVHGVGISTLDSGGDGPVVLLLHGLSSSIGFWERQIPAFAAAGYRVIAPDLPGYGASDRPDAPYTPPWFADQVLGLLDALGVQQAAVVGHSMGGQIAITLALAHPERLRALVLVAPAGVERFTPGEGAWMKQYWTEGRALEADEEVIRANFTVLNFARMDEGVERLIEERVRLAETREFRGTSVAVARSVAGMIDFPVADRLPELRARTLVVFGRQDGLIPNPVFHGGRSAAVGRAAEAAIPGAALLLLPRAGHMVQHDAAEPFNQAVLAFLQAGSGA